MAPSNSTISSPTEVPTCMHLHSHDRLSNSSHLSFALCKRHYLRRDSEAFKYLRTVSNGFGSIMDSYLACGSIEFCCQLNGSSLVISVGSLLLRCIGFCVRESVRLGLSRHSDKSRPSLSALTLSASRLFELVTLSLQV